jgi:hypothetical protein
MDKLIPHADERARGASRPRTNRRFRLGVAAISRYMDRHIFNPISKGRVKTTVEISDPLLGEVRELAAREGVTLRTLVERGLHHVVAATKREVPFKLRRATFKGKGRRPELQEASWDQLRDLIYKDRGA